MITIPKPVVVVVGADKGGVGKTTVSRALLDYFSTNNAPSRAFDTESPRGTLQRFYPSVSEIIDFSSTPGKMRVIDTLGAERPSVSLIDVRAGLLSPALQEMRDIGFLDAVKSGRITLAVFHILGSSIASLDEMQECAGYMEGAKYFLVKNHVGNNTFFEWDETTHLAYFQKIKAAGEINIPKLDEMAFEKVEVASVPFVKFIGNKDATDHPANYSFVLRGKVRKWIGDVWAEFDRVGINGMVGLSQHTLVPDGV